MSQKVKIIILWILFSIPIFASGFHVPRQDGFVRDITGTLTPEQDAQLELYSQKLQEKTNAQIATLIVNNLDGDSVEEAAVKTFQSWGIGQKGKDNGVLFIISIKDKKMRIEVGYGLEGVLPDGKTGEILDKSVIPLLKQGQLALGIMAGHKKIISIIDPTILAPVTPPAPVRHTVPLTRLQHFVLQNLFILVIVLVIGLLMISPGFRAFFILLLLSGRVGGGGSGGFGGGTSFGGFGGGSSGGGGSSRDW